MARTFSAGIREKNALTKRQMRKVAIDSISDVMEGAMTSARGVTAGGTLVEGKIPVVSSDLIKSLVSASASGGPQVGADSYAVVIAGMELSDFLSFAWDIVYSRRAEYGFTGTDKLGREFQQSGWHFVGKNAAKFPEHVKKNVRLVMK